MKKNQPGSIKPKLRDYLMFALTRFLPITKKTRQKLRYRLLKVKEDIVLFESKSFIVLQVCISLLLAELLFIQLGVTLHFYLIKDSVGLEIGMLLIEYILFLLVTPLASLATYPFTGFWVKLEE